MGDASSAMARRRPQHDRRGSLNLRSPANYDAVSPIGFVLFLVFVLFSYLQIGFRVPVLGSIRAEFILGLVLSVLSVFALSGRASRFDPTPVGKWSLALICLMAVMTLLSADPVMSWDIFLDRGVKFAMLALFIATFVSTPLRLRLFILVFLLACAKMGQEGLHGTLTGTMVWDNQGIPRLRGATPSYAQPNSFTGVGVGAMPFIFFIWPLVSWKWRVGLGLLTIAMLNIVLKTGSRAGYVAFFAGVVWIVAQAQKRWKAVLILALLAVAAVPLIPDEYLGRAVSIFEHVEVGEDTSKGKRMEIIADAWTVFVENPLGVGVGAFPMVRQARFGRAQDTHNLYLEVGTNLGVQGLVIFLGLVYAIFSCLLRVRRVATGEIESLSASNLLRSTDNITGIQPAAHIMDLRWIVAAANAFLAFMVVRLVFGLFGMDLYERYWWFAGGGAIALWNILRVAQHRSALLMQVPVPLENAKPLSAGGSFGVAESSRPVAWVTRSRRKK